MTDRDYENTIDIVLVDAKDDYGGQQGFPFEGPLDLLIEKLTALRDGIPEECRENASFKIGSDSGYEGSTHATVSIEYFRPITPEECDARDRSRAQRAAQERTAELVQLRRLSQKLGYGDPVRPSAR